MTTARAAVDQDIAEEVSLFLHAHPSFLADNPQLYRVLTPPVRVHGDVLADHMAAMLRAERAQTAGRADGAAERGGDDLAGRVHQAVLALIRCHDPLECVLTSLPQLLDIDAAALCVEHPQPGTRLLPRGTLERLLRGRDVLLRQVPSETRLLHGNAADRARADALVRVRLPDGIRWAAGSGCPGSGAGCAAKAMATCCCSWRRRCRPHWNAAADAGRCRADCVSGLVVRRNAAPRR